MQRVPAYATSLGKTRSGLADAWPVRPVWTLAVPCRSGRGAGALVQARACRLGHRDLPGLMGRTGQSSAGDTPPVVPSARAAAAAPQENEPGARCHWAISPYRPAVNSRAASAG